MVAERTYIEATAGHQNLYEKIKHLQKPSSLPIDHQQSLILLLQFNNNKTDYFKQPQNVSVNLAESWCEDDMGLGR